MQSGKWNAYTNGNNKIINDAYNNGETTVRVSVGRQRYTINFNCMSQVNEETGNHRPVVLGLLSSVSSPRVSNHVSTELSYILSSDNEETSNVNADEQKPKLNRLNKKTPSLTEVINSFTSLYYLHHNSSYYYSTSMLLYNRVLRELTSRFFLL